VAKARFSAPPCIDNVVRMTFNSNETYYSYIELLYFEVTCFRRRCRLNTLSHLRTDSRLIGIKLWCETLLIDEGTSAKLLPESHDDSGEKFVASVYRCDRHCCGCWAAVARVSWLRHQSDDVLYAPQSVRVCVCVCGYVPWMVVSSMCANRQTDRQTNGHSGMQAVDDISTYKWKGRCMCARSLFCGATT